MKLLAETIVSVTEFRKSPHLPDGVSLMAVMKNNEAEYYCITPIQLARFMAIEKQHNDMFRAMTSKKETTTGVA